MTEQSPAAEFILNTTMPINAATAFVPESSTPPHIGQTFALANTAILTKHQKLPLVAPALSALGFHLQLTEDFDTDTLGTFAGEIPRQLSPLECVKTKAKLAAELTGLRFGIGSEGSFGGGPMPGLVNWDNELLCMYDSQVEQFIIARGAGPFSLASLITDDLAMMQTHLEKSSINQGWICTSSVGLVKGLIGFSSLLSYLQSSDLLKSPAFCREKITLSPDLRAHLCPERQQYIQQAALQLAERIQARCPVCAAADFWRKAAETGLNCAACDYPTPQIKHYIKQCECCGHKAYETATSEYADPMHCPRCNP